MDLRTHPALRPFLAHENGGAGARLPAVFDCDGTVIKGDIGEAMLYRQIEQFLFRRSPADVWEDHPRHGELDDAFSRLRSLDPSLRRGDPRFPLFADIILSWYFDQIAEGNVAKACADIVRLFAGYTLDEVRAIADDTFRDEISAPLSERRLGSRTLPRGVRFLRETSLLVKGLVESGTEVWAVSGSSVWSVEPVFRALGVPAERVIGIDLEMDGGVFTPVPRVPIPIRGEKVGALKARTTAQPGLVASDSKNDIPLFRYSQGVKIFVNSRNRDPEEFFRKGNVRRDDSWIVVENPTPEEGNDESWQTYR